MHYVRPSSLEEAVKLAAQENAFILAGGSDLLVKMKSDMIDPDIVIDIKAITGLGDVREADGGFSIGAAVPCAALGEHVALKGAWPGVVEAANLIGSKQVQGRCTIAGNLCNASPAADSIPALVAADAQVVVVGPSGKRTVSVKDIPTGPGKTSLAPGEIVESIELGKRPPRSSDAYLRFIPRTEMDIAVVSAAVNLTLDSSGVIENARVALGAVAVTVLLVTDAADAIIGTKLDAEALDKLAEACSAASKPIADKRGTVAYRKKVAGVLARRAAEIAYKRAGGK